MSRAQRILEVAKRKRSGGPVLTIEDLKSKTKKLREHMNEPRPVKILKVTPLVGNQTVSIKAEAHGTKSYPMTVTFYGVEFQREKDPKHPLAVTPEVNERFYMEQASERDHPVQVRCQCPDFRFTWAWWDKNEKALSGRNFAKYTRKTKHMPERNPKHVPGLCKHLVGLTERLRKDRLLKG